MKTSIKMKQQRPQVIQNTYVIDGNVVCPVKLDKNENRLILGYVISSDRDQVRKDFSKLMGQEWDALYRQGWRLRSCNVSTNPAAFFKGKQ